MRSKQLYKICIRSVILRELEALRKYKGFCVIFPKILDAIEHFTKLRIFLTPLSITLMFFEYENFRLPFPKKISLIILKRCKKN